MTKTYIIPGTLVIVFLAILLGLLRAGNIRKKYKATGKKTPIKIKWWQLLP